MRRRSPAPSAGKAPGRPPLRPGPVCRIAAALLLLALPVLAAARPASAQPADSAAGPPMFLDESRGARIDAAAMLGQEDVGGLRHILLSVTLTQGSTVVTAPRGYYYTGRDLTAMGGGVRLVDTTLTVSADTAAYYRLTRRLEAFGQVVVTEKGLRLEGGRGIFDRDRNSMRLEENVVGEEAGRTFRGDAFDWDRTSGRTVISGRASFDDPGHHAFLRGRRILHDPRGITVATGDPVLDWKRGDSNVSVAGRELRFMDGGNRFEAVGEVIVRQGTQTVTADSAVFFEREGTGHFFGGPSVTDNDGRVTGDSLRIVFADDAIERAVMMGDARLDYAPSDPELAGERSLITGDSLTVLFDDGRIESLSALGSPTIDYTPSRADSALGTGRVEAAADTVTVTMADGAVDRLQLAGGAKGRYFYRPQASVDSVDRVDYAADRILFRIADRMIQMRGAGQTDYRTLTLKADEIDFDAKREALTAGPKPILIDRGQSGGQEVVGEKVTYDLGSNRGTIYHGRTQYDTGYIFADSLRKVTSTELNAGAGRYTTCDLIGQGEDPHFHFTSRRMKIFLGDKVVAKPVTVYIGNIPVFALPFYVFSIRKGRHSGLLLPRFEFGITGEGDRFFENLGYYWAANDYTDYEFRAAYRENPGVLIGEMTGRYARRGSLSGRVDVGHAFGLDRGLNQFLLQHNQTIGDGARLTANLEFADPEYRSLRGLSAGIGNRVDRQLRSTAALSKSWRAAGITMILNASLTEAIDSDLEDDIVDPQTQTRLLPSLALTMTPRTLGRRASSERPAFLPWASTVTYGLIFNGQNTHTEGERQVITGVASDTTSADTTQVLTAADNRNGVWRFNVQDNRKLLGFLTFGPRVSVIENWVDREFTPTDTLMGFHRAATWSLGLASGFSAYGTVAPNLFGLTALRHTFSPSVTLNYNPDFKGLTYIDSTGARRSRYPGVGAVRSQTLSYEIDNRFQAKVRSGETINRLDLFSWRLSGSYDLLAASEGTERPASNISSSVDLNRVKNIKVNFRSLHDPYHQLQFVNYALQTQLGLAGRLPGVPGERGAAPAAGDAAAADDGEWGDGTEGADGSGQRARPAAPAEPGYDRAPSVYDRKETAGEIAGEALNWRATLGFSLSGSRLADDSIESTANLNGGVDLKLSKNWGLRYSNAYAFETDEFTYHQVQLSRELHCWEASFSYSSTPVSSEFYFRISVKSLPDLKFESGPGLGAFDSISRISPAGNF